MNDVSLKLQKGIFTYKIDRKQRNLGMDETKKSFNVNYKEIDTLFFNEVFELIKKSGNEQKALHNLESNIELFKKTIIAGYKNSESKKNNPNVQSNQSDQRKQSSTSIDSPSEFPNIIF